MEPGESLRETCERELAEEVGIRGSVTALISITSSPDWLVIFPDGNKCQFVSALYLVKARSTKIATSCEATAARFFSKRELAKIDLIANHRERVADAFRFRGAVIER